jgi:hypothetical protein
MKMSALCLLAAVALMVGQASAASAQESPGEAEAAASVTAEVAADAISRAEAARRLAAEYRAEWLETAGLIEKAHEQAALGHYENAMALAEEARQQGELAVAQAEREAEAWQRRVVR